MATVYLAHDLRHDRAVALKVLQPELAVALGPDRFLREIAFTARLDHPHILPLLDSGEVGGFLYYVMPYVEGESLRDRLQRENQLPLADALHVALEVADALSYAHDRGIVHRDIKPENIMLAGGHARVADFGIARAVTAARGETLTETGLAVGTPVYMSPEQAAADPALDARTDIYSLGCVVYEMLAGQPPFTGATAEAILARKSLESVPSLRVVREAVPLEVEQAITKALAKVAADRFMTASQFAEVLDRGRGALGPGFPTAHWMPRRRLLLASGAALVALSAAWWGLTRPGPPSPAIHSLAVLPLQNLMGDPEQEFFVEGMHEALTAELSRIGALRVISRTSAIRYRDSDKDMPQIARELGVDGLIEGSVLREGDRVRITVQLIYGPSDQHLWAESYERDLRGVLALQAEVARAVAHEIAVTVTPQEGARLATVPEVDPEAYVAYLKGRRALDEFSEPGWQRAIAFFQDAIATDSVYARAYAGLAEAYLFQSQFASVPRSQAYSKAKEAVQKALELEATLAEAYTARGLIRAYYDWDWSGAERDFLRAIELNPGNSWAYHQLSVLLARQGRDQEATAQIQRALALDPLGLWLNNDIGWISFMRRDYDGAGMAYRKTLELEPRYVMAHRELAWVLAVQGRYDEAIAEARTAVEIASDDYTFASLGYVLASAGRTPEALTIMNDLRERLTRRHVAAYDIALVYVGMGENDDAFTWLEKAYEQRDGRLANLRGQPLFDGLRDQPRFRALLANIGLQ